MKAIYIEQPGGPEALHYGDMPKPELAPGHALVKVAASGVNFIDTYHRSGFYKIPLPAVLGSEGAGTVEAGTQFKKGTRVAWAMARGSYAEYALVPESYLVELPDGVDFRDGAAAMLQGMTAHYLTHSTYALKKGDTALIHAAAGGTGLLLVQMAKLAGARVIGTTSTEAKAQLARQAGADEIILYSTQDFVAETRRLTDGKGVDVVYDSVGNTTLMKSLDCLRPRGMAVSFGQSSGAVPPLEPLLLGQKGSLFLTRPVLTHYIADRQELEWRASDIFRWIAEKKLVLRVEREYPLADAAEAHRDLEARRTTGKLILLI
ncbi:MAG: quinone oxidoreductase [Bryobacteraceae bacterium]|jgi:NADPH2:quinone reductase